MKHMDTQFNGVVCARLASEQVAIGHVCFSHATGLSAHLMRIIHMLRPYMRRHFFKSSRLKRLACVILASTTQLRAQRSMLIALLFNHSLDNFA